MAHNFHIWHTCLKNDPNRFCFSRNFRKVTQSTFKACNYCVTLSSSCAKKILLEFACFYSIQKFLGAQQMFAIYQNNMTYEKIKNLSFYSTVVGGKNAFRLVENHVASNIWHFFNFCLFDADVQKFFGHKSHFDFLMIFF